MTSKNIHAYTDVREAFDKALLSERGIKISCKTPGRAKALRQRFYSFRLLDQNESKRLFPPEDSRFGVSVYDELTVTIEDLDVVVKRRPLLEVEEL